MTAAAPLAPTGHRREYTTPVALAIRKRDRLCIVAKLTQFYESDELILATAWRSQPGTERAVSLPSGVIDYARSAGARWYYLRDDRLHTMYRIPLDRFFAARLAGDGERYVPLAWFEPTAWRDWRYAEQTIDLTPPIQQLALWPVLGGGR